MNYKIILPVVALAVLFSTSCDDEKMEWETRDPNSLITVAEIPLSDAEKISRYDALNSYSEMKIGVGIDLTLYMEDETYAGIVNENFDEIAVGYHMKHGAMVNSKGELGFTSVDALIEKLKTAGLDVYGHTLVWHQNQNASYLNSLIAPEVIPEPAGTNLVENGDFENGATGWGSWGSGKESVEATTDVKLGGEQSLKIVSNASSSNEWDVQVQSLVVDLVVGHHYEISFWVKSEGEGGVRLSFGNDSPLGNQYPWHSTEGGLVVTSSTWKEVIYSMNTIYTEGDAEEVFVAVANSMQFNLDFGKIPSMTYYLDNVRVVDLDAEPAEVNYVDNGSFESDDFTNWTVNNAGAGTEVTNTESIVGSYSAQMTASSSSSNPWDLQLQSDAIVLEAGKDYVLTFYVKADQAGEGRVSFPGLSNEYPWNDWFNNGGSWTESFGVTTSWQQYTAALNALEYADESTSFKLSFDFGYLPDVVYYLDNVVVTDVSSASEVSPLKAATTIEKTDEEKTQIIGNAMESWISQMVGHYKNDVHAWDVVNEPMNENGSVRDGNVSDPASDEFYWVKYLGQDYAVTAFKLARQYGNADDVLFINDYNLEYSIPKCEGLIAYVEYIESQGAQVDGIGTQMHININSNKDNITQMLTLLAATGKKIRISEFDVQVQTDSPSAENYASQADMYQFVVDSYRTIIPESQQYGITVWGVSDAVIEHESWLPDDAPCLWNARYERKLSYKTFADGLAGRDVSEDFTGELDY